MAIDISEITTGSRDGEIVFVCDYRRPDIHKKAIRCVQPTKVMVCNNEENPPRKTVYYSKSHFVPVGVGDVPLKKVIAPFDNTGYRSYTGESVQVFETYAECVACWNKQLDTVRRALHTYRTRIHADLDKEIAELNERKL